METEKVLYIVFDTHKNFAVGIRRTRKSAMSLADKLDLAYGAVRYIVRYQEVTHG